MRPITYRNKHTDQTVVIKTQQAMDRFFDNRDPNAWDIVN